MNQITLNIIEYVQVSQLLSAAANERDTSRMFFVFNHDAASVRRQ